jgi:hypothetical protein
VLTPLVEIHLQERRRSARSQPGGRSCRWIYLAQVRHTSEQPRSLVTPYSGITISGGAGAGVGEFWCSNRRQPLLSLWKTLVP